MGNVQREEVGCMFFVATGENAKALDGERSKADDATITVAAYAASTILPDALIIILIEDRTEANLLLMMTSMHAMKYEVPKQEARSKKHAR